jgi:hypothetical protein
MALHVIGAGFGRTGTLSLKLALEALGIGRCYHMLEFRECPAHVPLWRQVADGRRDLWDTIFDRYHASVDWPGCRFWRDLATWYPDAKVILTIRDPERWYESIANTIYPWFIRGPSPSDRPHDLERRAVNSKIIMEQTFGGRLGEREHAIGIFERHNEQVRHAIPSGRLLVYRVTDGWEPLCAFLGRAVPDAAFPNVNTTDDFRKRLLADKPGATEHSG